MVLVFVCLFKMRNKKQKLPWSEGGGGVLSLRVGGKSASSLGNIYIFFSQMDSRIGFSLIRILQQKEKAWERETGPQA